MVDFGHDLLERKNMKKLFMFILGCLLFALSGVFGFALFKFEKEVTVKVGNEELEDSFVSRKKLEAFSNEMSVDPIKNISSENRPSGEKKDAFVSLPPSHQWKTMEVPVLKIFVANIAKIPMVQITYLIHIETDPQGKILSTSLIRKGKLAELPKFGWETTLFLSPISPEPLGYKTFKDYQVYLFVYRKGFPKVHYFNARIRLFSNGDVKVIQ
ncbi:MAG: hypothetical protein D6785_00025 [Planctomycetota bacterium]|nr:MAG: hypothetical protein D6785_00025 [Planctomycetota bacterium]